MKSEETLENQKLSKNKSIIFKIGALLFALLIIISFEGVLRLIGYGTDYHIFIEDKGDSSSLIMNPEVSKKYFSELKNATAGLSKSFRKEKDPKTFRVFILGASTTIGYPYRYNGGFHHWLEYGLNRTYPNKRFEIINVSLTAINSYALLDFTRQLVDYQVDAVLIYAGHNEYYGALGVASTSSFGKAPWLVNGMIKLKNLRTTQFIANSISSLKENSNDTVYNNETLMRKMVQDQTIPLDSEFFELGIAQYTSNLENILQILKSERIPTFIGTLVSNLKDVKPFISDSTNAEISAKFWFATATSDYAQGNFQQSKANFIKAKELDLLRFRAPEKMNRIIEDLALKYTNVTLVKTKEAFESMSPNGIIGNELLLEHVHPNIKGYAVLGYAFYDALTNMQQLNEVSNKPLTFDELWEQMPITVLDSITGKYEILMLKEGWPYYEAIAPINSDSLSVPEVIAGRLAVQNMTWDEASQTLYAYYNDNSDYSNALKVIEAATIVYPNDSKYYEKSGEIAAKLLQSDKAFYLFDKAHALDPSTELAKRISRTLIENGFYEESLTYLNLIKTSELDNTFATQLYDLSKTILNLQKQEDDIKSNPDIGIQLVENYLKIGNTEKASLSLETVLKYHPQNEKAQQLKKKIN